ncbi:MAG: hypothetical protein H7Y86_13075 [Rhizobacter sp.]|nr:hypothetical protein [Ferruginibacter sp.]
MENSFSPGTANEEAIIDKAPPLVPPPLQQQLHTVIPAEGGRSSCSTCDSNAADSVQYVYTIGRIRARFPGVAIEREFAQAVGRIKTDGMTDNAVMYKVLSDPQNLYLARKICWTIAVEGMETYLLQPMVAADLDMLISSLKPTTDVNDINVVLGVLGPIAPPAYCNGLQLPIIGFTQVYSFDVPTLIKSIPNPDKAKNFTAIAEELFMRIMQMTDNAGATDDHRALNYLAVRYPGIYATAADCYARNFSLTGVEARPSALNGTRKMVDVIFTFSNRVSDATEKYYCRVDVTEEFPFLVTRMQSYLER